MKNVKEYEIGKHIVKTEDEFRQDVKQALGNNVEIEYSTIEDELFFFSENGDVDKEEVFKVLSEYYDVKVINSIHVDGVEYWNVWISFSECEEKEIIINEEGVYSFGDGTIAKAESNSLPVKLNTFDSLEYDCWELIKKYAEQLGVELENEEDIDFYAAKTVQDTVLGLFTEAGFTLKNK